MEEEEEEEEACWQEADRCVSVELLQEEKQNVFFMFPSLMAVLGESCQSNTTVLEITATWSKVEESFCSV